MYVMQCFLRDRISASDDSKINTISIIPFPRIGRTNCKHLPAGLPCLAKVHRDWNTIEETLSQDMSILSTWLKQWRLKLSEAKTVSATFHLNNQEAKRELSVNIRGRRLTYQRTPWSEARQNTEVPSRLKLRRRAIGGNIRKVRPIAYLQPKLCCTWQLETSRETEMFEIRHGVEHDASLFIHFIF